MFRELMPLLKERTVMMTLSRVDDQTIRVCVIPKRIKEETKGTTGEKALCSPLAVTATLEELDKHFASQLSRYTSSAVALGSNFAEIEAAHQAATKALKEENKKELDRQRGKGSPKANSNAATTQGPVIKDGKPVFGSKDGVSSGGSTLVDVPSATESEGRRTETIEPPTTESVASGSTVTDDSGSAAESASTTEQAAFNYPD